MLHGIFAVAANCKAGTLFEHNMGASVSNCIALYVDVMRMGFMSIADDQTLQNLTSITLK